MNIAQRIYQLRTSKNMSQTDLAEALDVSRQSISKWETGAATPELEKLVNLSRLFNITLDELVNSTALPEEKEQPVTPQPEPQVVQQSLPMRKIAGIILFCMAFLTVLVCTVFGGFIEGIISSLPFIVGGIICFAVKKRTPLFFVWSVYMFLRVFVMQMQTMDWYVEFSINHSDQHLIIWNFFEYINYLLSIAYIVLEIFTFISFRDTVIKTDAKNKVIYALLWLVLTVFLIPHFSNIPFTVYNIFTAIVVPICTAIPIMTIGFVRYKNGK